MSKGIPLAAAGALALLLTTSGFAQAVVGYGALTGAVATVPGAAGKAAADRLAEVGSKIGGSAVASPQPAETPMGLPGSAASAEASPEAASIVLRAQWGSAEAAASPDPASAFSRDMLLTRPVVAGLEPEPRPQFLRRGAKIDDLIQEIGKPALVIQNVSGVGYDRKYVFAPGASRRYSVLVLGALVVDWEQQQ